MINKKLAEKQKLSDSEVANVEFYQEYRESLVRTMRTLDPAIEYEATLLRELSELWRKNEFRLQYFWKFEENSAYHREFNLPHCTCPHMDNEELVGTNRRIISEDCPYHS